MNTNEPYQYQPLESNRHIRLLRVQVGYLDELKDAFPTDDFGHDVKISDDRHALQNVELSPAYPMPAMEIVHTGLDDAPEFEAVSYTWGKPVRRETLQLQDGGGELLLTDNLALALPYLALRCRTCYLWIDQICIDQYNPDEKSSQIPLMGSIYRQAARVLVWLDPDSHVFEAVSAFHGTRGRGESSIEFEEESFPALSFRSNKKLLHRYYSQRMVTKTEWFTRGWVVQEFVLAKSVLFLERAQALPAEILDPLHDSAVLLPHAMQSLFSLRNLLRRVPFPDHAFLLSVLANYGPYFRTSEDRDRLFAFLGFWNPPGFVPEYQSPIKDISQEFVLRIAGSTGWLDFLACTRTLDSGLLQPWLWKTNTWPTWVPEWHGHISPGSKSDDQDQTEPFWTPWERFQEGIPDSSSLWYKWRASKGFAYEHRTGTQVRRVGRDVAMLKSGFCVKGKVIDWISLCSRDCAHRHPCAEDRCSRCFLPGLTDTKAEETRGYVKDVGSHFIGSFRHTITENRNLSLEKLMNTMAECLNSGEVVWDENSRNLGDVSSWPNMNAANSVLEREHISNLAKSSEQQELRVQDRLKFVLSFARYCFERSVFQTHHGKLGLAGPLNNLSDEDMFGKWPNGKRKVAIAIIHGCSVPLILRSGDPDLYPEENVYHVLTECYVHGMMYGEVVDWKADEADDIILA